MKLTLALALTLTLTLMAASSAAADGASASASAEEKISLSRQIRVRRISVFDDSDNSVSDSDRVQESIEKLGFDIYGDSSIFHPSSSVEVDHRCRYTATVRLQLADADVPFPPVMPGPTGPGSCVPEGTDCNGQSCLYEVRNVYRFSEEFEQVTGFNHMGVDWSPCGHPPLDKFARPHWNLHIFRVTPEERLNVRCSDGMANPFICQGPPFVQPTPEGKAFYVWGKDPDGNIANIPSSFEDGSDAVPSEAVHAYDHEAAAPVADWINPQLIMGLYDGRIQFLEPMFPYEFVSGTKKNKYEESVEYAYQTIPELPSKWSLTYNPNNGGFTTLILEGQAKVCEVETD